LLCQVVHDLVDQGGPLKRLGFLPSSHGSSGAESERANGEVFKWRLLEEGQWEPRGEGDRLEVLGCGDATVALQFSYKWLTDLNALG
jgi:hypothetical protein